MLSPMKNDNDSDYQSYRKYYSEQRFWNKLRRQASKAGMKVVYGALLCYYVLTSPEVPIRFKAAIVGALGYLIFPIDAIPDFIPVAGYTDDLSAIVTVLKLVSSCITPTIRHKSLDKLHEFFGQFDDHEIDKLYASHQ